MISVVIPTHNRPEMLVEAVKSACHQRGVEFEVIIVDDASSDHTPQLIQELISSEPKLRAVRNETSRYAPGARNRGALEARGEYISFLDDDDQMLSGGLLAIMGTFQQSRHIGVVHSPFYIGNWVAFQPLNGNVQKNLLKKFYSLPTSTISVRKSVFMKLEGFDETMQPSEDIEFCLRAAKVTQFKTLDKAYINHRQHDGGRLIDNEHECQQGFERVLRKNFPDGNGGISKIASGLHNNFKANGCYGQAQYFYERGHWSETVGKLLEALRLEPLSIQRWSHFLYYGLRLKEGFGVRQ